MPDKNHAIFASSNIIDIFSLYAALQERNAYWRFQCKVWKLSCYKLLLFSKQPMHSLATTFYCTVAKFTIPRQYISAKVSTWIKTFWKYFLLFQISLEYIVFELKCISFIWYYFSTKGRQGWIQCSFATTHRHLLISCWMKSLPP